MKHKNLIPPKKDLANKTHEYLNEVTKTVTGGLFNPLVDIILPSLHQKNFEKWCQNVYEKLVELDIEKISNDEEFISLLKEAVSVASKTHKIEKHELLKKAILNHFENEITFDTKIMYIKLIDTLTVSHIIVLNLINNNYSEIKLKKEFSDIIDIFKKNKEFLKIEFNILRKIFSDLENLQLIEIGDIKYVETVRQQSFFLFNDDENKNSPYINITDFGKGFVSYLLKN